MISSLLQRFGKPQAVNTACNSNDSRIVIIHNHLFKNAGSTIDWALRKNFGKDFVDHRDNDSMISNGTAYLEQYLSQNIKIRALSSHHLPLPLPVLTDAKLLTIMMFRHPIERVTSVYNFERKQKNTATPGASKARKLSLKEYIIWRMQPNAGSTIRNFHIRRAIPSYLRPNESFSKQTVTIAKEFLSAIPMLGLVERFDESMVLFEDCLSAYFPNIDLSYKPQNIGQHQDEDRMERVHRLKEEIGDETYNLLLSKNQEDLELYVWVEHEFEKRISTIDNFGEKLDKFRAKCSKKQKLTKYFS